MSAVIVSLPQGNYRNHDAVEKVVNYIMRLQNPKLIGGYGVFAISPDLVIREFYMVKKVYNKMENKQIVHIVISIEESLPFTPLEVRRLAEMIAQYFAYERQVIFAVHDDTKHLHIHMGINTVAYTNGNYCGFFDISELREYAKKCMDILIDEVIFNKKIKQK